MATRPFPEPTWPTARCPSARTWFPPKRAATGTGPLVYQWLFNGTPLGGATSSNLVLNGVTAANAGTYAVVVTNVVGSVTSANAILTVNVPVTITQQPQSQTVNPGADVTFSVAATGTGPLVYQWLFNGAPLSGATSSNLSLNGVTAANGGTYAVVVTNVVGPVTSASATLTVNVPLTITQQPQSQTVNPGANVTLSVGATGTSPLAYQWLFNGNAVSGATASNLVLNGVSAANAGAYAVVVTNVVGSVTSANAILTVNVPVTFTQQPQSQTVNPGADVTFSVAATGTGPLVYQWLFNGTPLSGATSSNLVVTSVAATNAGTYAVVVTNVVGSVTSSNAVLTVGTPPGVSSGPNSQTVVAGTNVLLAVAATGTPPMAYQWFFNGVAMPGATNVFLSLSTIQPFQAGNYNVVLANPVGTATNPVAVVTVLVPPVISVQPQSQAVNQGSNVLFSVTATGTGPLNYEWLFNGTPLPGAINPSLMLSNVQPTQAGTYAVTVTNLAGSVTSSNALLVVIVSAPPRISNPQLVGQTFSVSVETQSGVTYVLEAKQSLKDSSWVAVQTAVGNGQTISLMDTATLTTIRFYRIRVE